MNSIPDIIKHKIDAGEEIVLDLGCGPHKSEGSIGVDGLQLENVDIVADLEQGLPFIPDNSVSMIKSRHFLEHINNFEGLLAEIHRVLKPGAIHQVIVPYFANPHYYSDYTHKMTFGLYSFDYFGSEASKLKRKVPSFYNDFRFDILNRKLVFKSRFPLRHFIKRLPQFIFNSSSYMQELYEELFCYFIPCSEIHFEMTPAK